jgi:exonuclease SbcC
MIELEITGFQSIERISLTVDRFTALVGRSNIGKSAIVRAVKAALTGAAGTDFVRHDPKTCSRVLKGNKKCKCKATVRMGFPEFSFLWEKGDSDNRYTVWRNGTEEVYDKLDRGTPEFLSPAFSPIKVGDSPHLINVGDQFEPIFLLGDPGSAVADVLSDVAKLDNLNAALRLVAKDKTACSSTLKVREVDSQAEMARLAGFAGLDANLIAISDLQAYGRPAGEDHQLDC